MNNKLLSCLIAGALGTTLALASPALAFQVVAAVAVAAWEAECMPAVWEVE